MHLCAVKCCDDKTGGIDNLHNCIERCSAPVKRVQKYVKELQDFQGRLQRCVIVSNVNNIHFYHKFTNFLLFFTFTT